MEIWMCNDQAIVQKAAGMVRATPRLSGGVPAMRQSVAIVEIRGVMSKFGLDGDMPGTATVDVIRQLQILAVNPTVTAVAIVWDTPGGTVAGTAELATAVRELSAAKMTVSIVEDLCCSAGFWCATQARKVIVGQTASTANIGTFTAVTDMSGMASSLGIKVHVIKSGQFKGMGFPGSAVSAADLAELQRVINELNSHFVAGVARGRRLSVDAVNRLADGRVLIGDQAVKAGMADAVGSLTTFLAAHTKEANAAVLARAGHITVDPALASVHQVYKGVRALGLAAGHCRAKTIALCGRDKFDAYEKSVTAGMFPSV